MNKRIFQLIIAVLMGIFSANAALACRYNVRETGFVDLGIEPYRLFYVVDNATPADAIATFKTVSAGLLAESNIHPEILNVETQQKHPALKHVKLLKIDSYPAAILISPDEPLLPPERASIAIPISKPGQPLEQTIEAALKRILDSPVRKKLIAQISTNYGAVLLFKGPDAEQNIAAEQAANDAVKTIEEQMDFLPKAIAHPPVTLVVDHNQLDSEEILLWSMTLTPAEVNQPHAAVIYGRGRWLGPMFIGEQIDERNLSEILFVVGNDCECGLDYRWLQGTMLPAPWTTKTRELVAKDLGFDPENPMIMAEMARILGRGGAFYPSTPYGYQELEIDVEPVDEAIEPETTGTEPNIPAPIKQIAPHDANIPKLPPVGEPNAIVAPPLPEEQQPLMQITILPFAGAAVIIFIIGIVIVIRANRK